MIVFPTSIIDNDAQWKAGPIPNAIASLNEYSQVTLSGDHVTFLADGINAPAALPGNMAHFSCTAVTGTPDAALAAPYQWPYTGAQAVVDVPKGTLSACYPGAIAPGRVDTQLTLNTTGRVTIVAMKEGVARTLILKADPAARIYVINVPARWAAGNRAAAAPGVVGHFVAYYMMVGRNKNSPCSGAPKVAVTRKNPAPGSCGGAAFLPPGGGTGNSRNTTALMLVAGAGSPTDGVIEALTSNSECSNSAWP
jgi:hypothetical protein